MSLTGDSDDPGTVRRHTGEHIWEALGASNTPRDGTNHVATSDQWTTRVSHAHTLSGLTEGTDGIVEHEVGIASGVTGTAVSVGQGGGLKPLQVVGGTARVLENRKR
jgi:hypothetical protein